MTRLYRTQSGCVALEEEDDSVQLGTCSMNVRLLCGPISVAVSSKHNPQREVWAPRGCWYLKMERVQSPSFFSKASRLLRDRKKTRALVVMEATGKHIPKRAVAGSEAVMSSLTFSVVII